MTCSYSEICGGCSYRHLSAEEYRRHKTEAFHLQMQNLIIQPLIYGEPLFIADGNRRRAVFAFQFHKGKLSLGFNAPKSSTIIDVDSCTLLTPRLNANLDNLKQLISSLCAIPFVEKGKKRKITESRLTTGDIAVCEADNGLDVVLEFDKNLDLAHRMAIFEAAQSFPDIIRISHRFKADSAPEPIAEKLPPYINIAGVSVYLPAGTFLQASFAGEKALLTTVLAYMGDSHGQIADLFCGVGTFSYALSRNLANKVTAIDSSAELLTAFTRSINKNLIPNISIKNKNLFKYPLDSDELKTFDVVVFDPPRAGALALVNQLAAMPSTKRPEKIIAVSCNPESFVRDANILISGGYILQEVTMVDQFVYSPHTELVALFTPNLTR